MWLDGHAKNQLTEHIYSYVLFVSTTGKPMHHFLSRFKSVKYACADAKAHPCSGKYTEQTVVTVYERVDTFSREHPNIRPWRQDWAKKHVICIWDFKKWGAVTGVGRKQAWRCMHTSAHDQCVYKFSLFWSHSNLFLKMCPLSYFRDWRESVTFEFNQKVGYNSLCLAFQNNG